MMSKSFYILILSVMLTGCLQTENSSSVDGFVPDAEGLFAEVIPVLSLRCGSCHTFHLETEEFQIAQGRIIPGDPLNSRIYYRITGSLGPNGTKDMPTFGSISPSERDLIYNWILEMQP